MCVVYKQLGGYLSLCDVKTNSFTINNNKLALILSYAGVKKAIHMGYYDQGIQLLCKQMSRATIVATVHSPIREMVSYNYQRQ